MKTIIATLVTVVVGLVALPDTAEARSCSSSSYTYKSGTSSCGCPIYTKRVFAGYDCYHRPTYRYYSVPVKHHCHGKYKHRSQYRSGYHHRGYYGSHYKHRSSHYGHRSHGSHISFRTGFGNVSVCR